MKLSPNIWGQLMTNDRKTGLIRKAGAVVQGLVLGLFLSIAVIGLIQASTQASVFRYQGF